MEFLVNHRGIFPIDLYRLKIYNFNSILLINSVFSFVKLPVMSPLIPHEMTQLI